MTWQWPVPPRYNIAVDVCDGRDPAALAMIYADPGGVVRKVGWAELATTAARFGNRYRSLGVARGDRIAFVVPPTPEAAAAVLGALRIGAIVVMASSLWGADALAYRLRDCTPRLVVTGADLATGPLDGLPAECPAADTAADDPALICYTSGTSGAPKGIVHAHRWLLGHNEFDLCHQLRPGEVFHGAGDWSWSMAKLLGPWRRDAVQFVYHRPGRFDPVALFTAMAAHGVSNVLLNPTVLRTLRAALPDAGAHIPVGLRVACCSSEPLSAGLIEWFHAQFGVVLLDYYGLTESYPMIGNTPDRPVRPGSMGTVLPGWEVVLLDAEGQPVPDGTPGEICLRAGANPQYPLGYWNRAEDSARDFGGPWFHTRDTARRDPDGHLFYLGRTDDVIISAGYRIGPAELEATLDTHPAVAESAVVGVPDDTRGQVVHAFVVLADGRVPSAELTTDLQRHVRLRHAHFAYPRHIDYLRALPRSTTNKIRRAALRQAAGTSAEGGRP